MRKKLIEFNLSQRKNKNIPELRTGDIIKVHRKIMEGGKERVQVFEGIIIAIKGKQSSSPIVTVRKVSSGIGVELILPVYSPQIEKIELVKRAKVRKAKLYYIRKRSAKSLRMKYKDLSEFAGVEKESEPEVEKGAEEAAEEKTEEKETAQKTESQEK